MKENMLKKLDDLFSSYGFDVGMDYINEINKRKWYVPRNSSVENPESYALGFLGFVGKNANLQIRDFGKFAEQTGLAGEWEGIPSWFGERMIFKNVGCMKESHLEILRTRFGGILNRGFYQNEKEEFKLEMYDFFEKRAENRMGNDYKIKKAFNLDREEELASEIILAFETIVNEVKECNLMGDLTKQASIILMDYYLGQEENLKA